MISTLDDIKKIAEDELDKSTFSLLCEVDEIIKCNCGNPIARSVVYFVELMHLGNLNIDQVYSRYGEDVASLVYDSFDIIYNDELRSEVSKCGVVVKIITASWFYVSIKNGCLGVSVVDGILSVYENEKATNDLFCAIKELIGE